MSQPRLRRGFTLVEVLVSLTLMTFLLSTATVAFVQMRAMTRRIQARQALHNTASVIHERLRHECDAMIDAGACWLRSDASGDGSVEFIFLRGKLDHLDFQLENNYGYYAFAQTDLVWSRWAYDGATQAITVAQSTPRRLFQLSVPWVHNGFDYQGQWLARLPEPVRATAGGPEVALERTAFGTADPEDYGDYWDLVHNAGNIGLHCSEFVIECVHANGLVSTVNPTSTTLVAIDGNRIDGRDAAAAARRPVLIRLRLTLSDPVARLKETFSFSFRTPNLLLTP